MAQIGCVAARVLRQNAGGTVRAVFERSFYLELDRQWICVGPPGLGAGPLNVLCEPENLAGAMTFVGVGGSVVCGDRLRVGPSLEISFSDAAVWKPDPPGIWCEATLQRDLCAFAAALPEVLPTEGLAPLLRATSEALSPVADAAQAPVRRLGELVNAAIHASADRTDANPLVPLIGLGPGLTPSGDDFLGGALIALHLLGLTPLRDAIWAALGPLVATATTQISGAHLAAAAEGFGGAALHALLDDVIAARTAALPQRVAALAAVGHTSGWDAMAGAITVLRAALR